MLIIIIVQVLCAHIPQEKTRLIYLSQKSIFEKKNLLMGMKNTYCRQNSPSLEYQRIFSKGAQVRNI